MALRTVTQSVEYIKWNEVEVGSVIKGYYRESKPSKNYPDNLNHYVRLESDGTMLGLNGSGGLDNMMKEVRPGWYVEITYKGKFVLEKGLHKGTACHQFDVAFDDERVDPLFSGDASARQPVDYKNSAAQQDTPPLAKPDQAPPAQETTQQTQQTTQQTPPAQDTPPADKPKRKIFG